MEVETSRFRRVLKQREVLTLSFGAMIGWSWVLLTGYWVEHAGSLGVLLAFLGGGIAILFIALTYAELASALPKTGGEHVYTLRTLGPFWSFVCTWALLMAYSTVCFFEAVALPTAVEYLIPQIRFHVLWTIQDWDVDLGFVIVGVLGAVIMTWINVLGIKPAAIVQTIVTAVIVLSGIVLFTGAAFHGTASNLDPLIAIPASGILVIVIMVPAYLVGFDVLPQSAEELNVPLRRVGTLLVISVALAVAWYAAISFAVASSMPRGVLAESDMASAEAAGALWSSSGAGVFLVIGGIGGILTSWNAFIIGGSRVLFALAETGFLPKKFVELHPKYRTPWIGILALGVISCVAPLFGRTILVWLINAGSFGVVVAYIFVPIAFLVLRRKEPELYRPFKLRFGLTTGIIAVILGIALLLLYFPPSSSALGKPEWVIILIWSAVGVCSYLYYLSRRSKNV